MDQAYWRDVHLEMSSGIQYYHRESRFRRVTPLARAAPVPRDVAAPPPVRAAPPARAAARPPVRAAPRARRAAPRARRAASAPPHGGKRRRMDISVDVHTISPLPASSPPHEDPRPPPPSPPTHTRDDIIDGRLQVIEDSINNVQRRLQSLEDYCDDIRTQWRSFMDDLPNLLKVIVQRAIKEVMETNPVRPRRDEPASTDQSPYPPIYNSLSPVYRKHKKINE